MDYDRWWKDNIQELYGNKSVLTQYHKLMTMEFDMYIEVVKGGHNEAFAKEQPLNSITDDDIDEFREQLYRELEVVTHLLRSP